MDDARVGLRVRRVGDPLVGVDPPPPGRGEGGVPVGEAVARERVRDVVPERRRVQTPSVRRRQSRAASARAFARVGVCALVRIRRRERVGRTFRSTRRAVRVSVREAAPLRGVRGVPRRGEVRPRPPVPRLQAHQALGADDRRPRVRRVDGGFGVVARGEAAREERRGVRLAAPAPPGPRRVHRLARRRGEGAPEPRRRGAHRRALALGAAEGALRPVARKRPRVREGSRGVASGRPKVRAGRQGASDGDVARARRATPGRSESARQGAR